jgi:DNA-binding transcriptional LysR family regulator
MELYQLRTLLVVARERHLTRAAELLFISQSAVSGQIKSLEQEFNIALFERRHGGIQPTKAGTSLLAHAEKVLSAADNLMVAAQSLSGKIIGKLSLGVIFSPEAIRLGELTTYLLERHPLLDIDIRNRNTLTVLSNIRSRELDASFFLGREIPPDIESIKIRSITYRIVASPTWRNKLTNAKWETIANMPWITTPREGAVFQMIDTLFRSHGLKLSTVVEADQESAIISLVRAGAGLGLIRHEVAARAVDAGELITWEKGDTFSTLSLIYLASRRADPIIQTLGTAINAVWGHPEENRSFAGIAAL